MRKTMIVLSLLLPVLAAADDIRTVVPINETTATMAGNTAPSSPSSSPTVPLHVVKDVQGPPLAATALGNDAEAYTPAHHAMIVENQHATMNAAAIFGSSIAD